jgi:hypothetical protein
MFVRRYAAHAAAIASILLVWTFTGLGGAPARERVRLASRFRFEQSTLPVVTASSRTVRTVRPSMARIANWISGVGASVALHDADGDGLSNDVWTIDTRSDEVVVAPVPRTGARFAPFDLLRAPGCAARNDVAPMGVLPGDVNDDGLTDALVYYWGRSPLLFIRHDKTVAASSFRCEELMKRSEDWFTSAAAFADVDGDGAVDIIAGNYFPDGSGVHDPSATSDTLQMQDSMSLAYNGGENRLLLRTGDGFREVPNVFPRNVARGWTLALGAQDLDGDLLPEIYFANDFGPDRLLRNLSTPGRPRFELIRGRRRFFDPKSKVLGFDSFKGMGIDFADINGDAVPDLFVSNITDDFAIEESTFLFLSTRGTLDYRDASERLHVARGGWSWDARFGDFDNDGVLELMQATGFVRGTVNRWPELHELAMANDDLLRDERIWPQFGPDTDLSSDNRNPFFVRDTDGRYQDVSAELGFAVGTISRGIATADVDGDGDLDFALANMWAPSSFFRNTSRAGNALVLHVRRGRSPAIGATAFVTTPRGRRMTAQVDGGNGHSGKRGPELHFGLGDERSAAIEIRWRDRTGKPRKHWVQLESGVRTIVLPEVL